MRLKKGVAILLAATTLTATLPYTSSYISDGVMNSYSASAASAYNSLDEYVAKCIKDGKMYNVETGESEGDVVSYANMKNRSYAYEELATNVMDDTGLMINSQFWANISAVLDGDISKVSQKQVYETFLTDYLTYSYDNSDNSAVDTATDIIEKTEDYQDKLIKKLIEAGVADSEEAVKEALEGLKKIDLDTSNQEMKSLSKNYVDALSESDYFKELSEYSGLLDDINTVSDSAFDYFEKLSQALALKEVNDERVEFLEDMKARASDNDDFCAAVDEIIETMESSYGEIAFDKGFEEMAKYSVSVAWDKLKDVIPGMSAVSTAKEGLNLLFDSDDTSTNNLRLVMQYTAGQYAKQALMQAYSAYISNPTEENADKFNACYQNFLAYQEYSSDFAMDFITEINSGGLLSSIFSDDEDYEYWKNRITTDINVCESSLRFVDNALPKYYFGDTTASDISSSTENTSESSSGTTSSDISETKYDDFGNAINPDDPAYQISMGKIVYTYYSYGMRDPQELSGSGSLWSNCDVKATVDIYGTLLVEGCGTLHSGYRSHDFEVFPTYVTYDSTTIPIKKIIIRGFTDIENDTYNSGTYYLAENYKDLTSLIISDSVKTIPDKAFQGCSALKEVTLGKSLESIGSRVFYNCTSLKTINFGNSLESIGPEAFRNCTSLINVNFDGSLLLIGYSAFCNCSSLENISIPDTCYNIDYAAFYDCKSLTTISFPNQISELGNQTFRNCSSLKSFEIPKDCTSIGLECFYGCTSLVSIKFLGDECTNIASMAFNNCSKLSFITFGKEKNISFGSDVFDSCESLKYMKFLNKNCTLNFGYSSGSGLYFPTTATLCSFSDGNLEKDINLWNNSTNGTKYGTYTFISLNGDVTGDNLKTNDDAVKIQSAVLKTDSITEDQFDYADYNGDGKVNVIDLAYLKQELNSNN